MNAHSQAYLHPHTSSVQIWMGQVWRCSKQPDLVEDVSAPCREVGLDGL